MKKYFLPFFFLLLSGILFAQDSHVMIKGYVDNETHDRLMGCNLQVFRDDQLIMTDTTGPSGMYKFDSLYTGHVYDIYFEAEGYSLKFVRIDVKEADRKDLIRYPVELNMALFSTAGIRPEKLYFLQSEPYALVKYNKETSTIEWDMVYLEKMKKKVEDARK